MKIKIPTSFKIGATKANVSIKKDLGSDEGYNGCYNKRTEELYIDSRLGKAKRDRTFGHELMEVIKENYELDLSEIEMSTIANGWIEFLSQIGIDLDWSDIENSKG